MAQRDHAGRPAALAGRAAEHLCASGYNNNDLFVIPAWNMVMVRLGLDEGEDAITEAEYNTFLRMVGEAIREPWIGVWPAGLLGLSLVAQLAASEPASSSPWPKSERFESAIRSFEAADKTDMPPQNAILFTGASNIVGWKTLAEDFPEHVVINRPYLNQ